MKLRVEYGVSSAILTPIKEDTDKFVFADLGYTFPIVIQESDPVVLQRRVDAFTATLTARANDCQQKGKTATELPLNAP